ncbi:FIG00782800: hypothetical protein [hydrothermal vent metagenome]|uniref:DUF1134 domain-containing protein n=1 Tax=hydrothermal vent metagenome TaxID=652676 RepID=A0A3B0S379_9ZZZZ
MFFRQHSILIFFVATLFLTFGCASSSSAPAEPTSQPADKKSSFDQREVRSAMTDYFGVTAEAAGSVVERIFRDLGEPNGYIYGSEGSVAIGVGLRYGKGTLQMADGGQHKVYWQGPSVGWDVGGNGSKVFTLVYNIKNSEQIYQRFPGVEGSAYLVAGMGVNYQRSNTVTLAPIRTGVGLRLGANVGYLSYSKKRRYIPL